MNTEAEEFYAALKSREFCFVHGPKKSGKTNLIHEASHRLQNEGVLCVVVQTEEIMTAGMTLDQWYLWILNDLVQKLLVEKLGLTYSDPEIQEGWDEFEGVSPAYAFHELFESLVLGALDPDSHAVIFVDQFEVVSQDIAEDFLVLLRAFYNERSQNRAYRKVTFVISGQNPLTEYKPNPPYNIGRAFELQNRD